MHMWPGTCIPLHLHKNALSRKKRNGRILPWRSGRLSSPFAPDLTCVQVTRPFRRLAGGHHCAEGIVRAVEGLRVTIFVTDDRSLEWQGGAQLG